MYNTQNLKNNFNTDQQYIQKTNNKKTDIVLERSDQLQVIKSIEIYPASAQLSMVYPSDRHRLKSAIFE